MSSGSPEWEELHFVGFFHFLDDVMVHQQIMTCVYVLAASLRRTWLWLHLWCHWESVAMQPDRMWWRLAFAVLQRGAAFFLARPQVQVQWAGN